MTWYLWVWGAVNTLAIGLWVGVGAVVLYEKWDERRARNQMSPQDYQRKIARLERELRETRKGQNEFGRISP